MTGNDALLLVDLQEAFFESPPLADERDRVAAAVTELAAVARRADVPVFLVTTEHSRDSSTWTLSMLEAGQGFLFPGESGTAVLSEVDVSGMTRMEKTRDSAWFGTDLLLRTHNLGVDHVVIAGVQTHACIAHTARDAYANNLRATIVTDAVADEHPEQARTVLDLLEADGQVELTCVAAIVAGWVGHGR